MLQPTVEIGLWIVGIILVAWISDQLTKRYLLRAISRIVAQTRFTWDDVILRRRVFNRLAHVAPIVVVYYGAPLVPGIPPTLVQMVQRVALAFLVVAVVVAVDGFLTALNDLYSLRSDAKSRPIKGYLQILKIAFYIVSGILVVSFLTGQRPALLLGGLGAMTAVLLLIFRDTILSLVASIQITQYDMVAVGDWIEMPKYGADGDVVDIALHTITIQNWDKTITTIPTHKFIEDSFKNWRGMTRSGGRRIKRSFSVDVNTIRFLDEEEIERFGKYELLRDYFAEKLREIDAYNTAQAQAASGLIPNARRLTNIGTLRAYIVSYLRHHPATHEKMTLMVRQLKPGPDGLPLELYLFSNDTNWVRYEAIQADIFDHIFAVIPEFGLRVFQAPSGRDLEALASVAAPLDARGWPGRKAPGTS